MRGYGKRTLALSFVVGLIGLTSASSASAALTIGSPLTNAATGSACGTAGPPRACTYAQRSLSATAPGGSTVPAAGVIVRWRIKVGTGAPGQTARLHVIAANTGTGVSAQVPLTVAGTFEFPTRVPVSGGESLGVDVTGVIPEGVDIFSDVAGTIAAWTPELGAFETRGSSSTFTGELLINADLEPDADGDGFGDETQDGCPTDAATQGACPDTAAPDTTITSQPKAKTKKKQATFEFTSSEPGSSFECTLDGKVFACNSPVIEKVGKGKHNFQVKAKDAAGNVDPTPANFDWKVKKKK